MSRDRTNMNPGRAAWARPLAAAVACAGALAYTVSKVDLARREELGMPGFPAPQSSYAGRSGSDVLSAQLGNAGLGLGMAAVALLLLLPLTGRLVRWTVWAVSWTGIAMVTAGVVGFTARATGAAPGLGEPPPHPAPAVAALVVGAVWAAAWIVVTVGSMRRPRTVPAGRSPARPRPEALTSR
ncbi:hypothetical protein [Streptomyces sp. SID5785]|uniref:hypothetical protein n=1 Tax=Streptomyces sp. SID5785 TaxID=2690309 RepID=UPI001926B318|nr:hypothetical protein [Streptomyces sp. SID5785]